MEKPRVESITANGNGKTKTVKIDSSSSLSNDNAFYILQGNSFTLTANHWPASQTFPEDTPMWGGIMRPFVQDSDEMFLPREPTITVMNNLPAGTYNVSATYNGSRYMRVIVTNQLVKSISGGGKTSTLDPDEAITDSETIYIHQGTPLTLMAAPDPTNSSFPSGKPTWSADGLTDYLSATSGTSITIDDEAPAGTYLVKASHNNTKVIKVVIAEVGIKEITGDGKTSEKGPTDTLTDDETIYLLHGTELTLDAIPDPAMLNFPSGKPTWSADGLANYLSATGSSSITISDEAPSGEYIISATCNNTKTIKVVIADVFIESISGGDKTSTKADSEELGDGETIYLAQGAQLTLTATPNPSTEEFPEDNPTWDCEDLSGYFDATSGASITISDEAPSGEYIISATCGNTKVMKVVITNVLLESIGGDGKTSTKENAEEIGENETIYLAQGAQLTLTAAPNPSTAEFPDDKPTWTADELFYYFDTATGESITVNDQAPAGEYIISATCGNTKVIKLVICELLSETQATIPTNRERIKIGVGEEVNLTIQPADIPTVVWTTTDGSFGDNDEYNASRQFIAPDRAANVTVTATFGGTSLTKTFNVVEPDEVTIEQSPGTNIWHINGIASVGFKGDVYILPADVSFHNIEIQEGEVDGVGTGYFAPDDGQVHTLGRWIAVGNVVADKGSKVAGIDTIRSRTSRTPYIDGTFIWSIPFSFRINNGNAKQFTTVNHMETIDTTGKMTISKGGTTKSANLDDPTSDF